MTTTWTQDELDRMVHAEELELASRRPDGSLRAYVTMWVIRAGDDIYVRSASGPPEPMVCAPGRAAPAASAPAASNAT